MSSTAQVLHNRLLAKARFRHLQVLVTLAELGSVQKSAQAIGLTQPGVTQLLADLEGLLEVTLFRRHARGVWPTPACGDLLPLARQALLGLSSTAEAVAARQGLGQGLVRVHASTAAMHGLLLEALPALNRAQPQLQLQVHESEQHAQYDAIARGELDLGVCRESAMLPQGWHFEPLRPDDFAVVAAPGHPLARRRRLRFADLLTQEWVISPISSSARHQLDQLFAAHGATPRINAVITRVATMSWSMLASGRFLTLVPRSVFRPFLLRGDLVALNLDTTWPMPTLGLLAPLDPPPATARLCEHLRAHALAMDAAAA